MFNIRVVKAIAKKEFRDTVRDNWTYAATSIFAVISVAISYFGMISRGQTGLQSLQVTIASLMSLVIYVVPIISLLLGYSAVSGEKEKGSLAIILSNPLSRGEVVLGKYLGLSLALLAATVVGFGVAGVLIMLRVGSQGWLNYVYFLLSSLALGLVFLSIGLLVSVLAKRKVGAAMGAIFLWFFFTFIYDSIILGALVVLSKHITAGLFSVLLLLNPGDVFRLANLIHMKQLMASYGMANLASLGMLNAGQVILVFLVWILAPLLLSIYAFERQDI